MYIDVILELLNTITGNLMRRMEMLTGPFTIGIPEYKIGNETNDNALIVKKYVVDEKNLIKVAITKIETIPQI
jgi:CheY-specific phosphatase CheX